MKKGNNSDIQSTVVENILATFVIEEADNHEPIYTDKALMALFVDICENITDYDFFTMDIMGNLFMTGKSAGLTGSDYSAEERKDISWIFWNIDSLLCQVRSFQWENGIPSSFTKDVFIKILNYLEEAFSTARDDFYKKEGLFSEAIHAAICLCPVAEGSTIDIEYISKELTTGLRIQKLACRLHELHSLSSPK